MQKNISEERYLQYQLIQFHLQEINQSYIPVVKVYMPSITITKDQMIFFLFSQYP